MRGAASRPEISRPTAANVSKWLNFLPCVCRVAPGWLWGTVSLEPRVPVIANLNSAAPLTHRPHRRCRLRQRQSGQRWGARGSHRKRRAVQCISVDAASLRRGTPRTTPDLQDARHREKEEAAPLMLEDYTRKGEAHQAMVTEFLLVTAILVTCAMD